MYAQLIFKIILFFKKVSAVCPLVSQVVDTLQWEHNVKAYQF